MSEVERVSDKRAQELVQGFFSGAGNWIREHGRVHTAAILRSDAAELEMELEAYRLAAETLQERGYRARHFQRIALETGSHRYYKVGIYLEF
jgi:hypothetical protein